MRLIAIILTLLSIAVTSYAAAPKHIKLPNGLYLRPAEALGTNIERSYDIYELANEHFVSIAPVSVRYANWYGDYVYGWGGYIRCESKRTGGFGSTYFIFKKGNAEAKLIEDPFEFEDYIASLNLPEFYHPSALFDSYEHQHKYGKYKTKFKKDTRNLTIRGCYGFPNIFDGLKHDRTSSISIITNIFLA